MMDLTALNAFVSGAAALAFGAIGVCFVRFWKRSHIRLFNLFAVAFFLLAVERVVLVLVNPDNELAPYVYSIRLAAFIVIIAAIIDQNRKGGPAPP